MEYLKHAAALAIILPLLLLLSLGAIIVLLLAWAHCGINWAVIKLRSNL